MFWETLACRLRRSLRVIARRSCADTWGSAQQPERQGLVEELHGWSHQPAALASPRALAAAGLLPTEHVQAHLDRREPAKEVDIFAARQVAGCVARAAHAARRSLLPNRGAWALGHRLAGPYAAAAGESAGRRQVAGLPSVSRASNSAS